jgi:iron(III) transport system ATP-binding protein
MTSISIEHLSKWYKDVEVLKNINLEVNDGDLVTLLGPSGCGKSTTLRILAGLEENQLGQVKFDNKIISDPKNGVFAPPERRNIGMVFQSYAIWPHMSVFDNVAYPLKVKHSHSSSEISKKVKKALELVGLEQLFGRFATQLSGGQQQRVALARALVAEPNVLLLDEPLSNLDAKLREQMRIEIKELHRRIGLTTIYVTHDQSESMSLSDKVVVMKQGVIQQIGSPEEVYNQPRNLFVSQFVGKCNFLQGTIAAKQDNGFLVHVEAEGQQYSLFSSGSYYDFEKNERVYISVRPEHIQLAERSSDHQSGNVLPFQVLHRLYFGSHFEYTFRFGNANWELPLPVDIRFHKDESVQLAIPADKIILLPEKEKV